MALVDEINNDIKVAMKAKAKETLEALRAVKSALLLAASEKGADGNVSEDAGILVLQRLVKQRKEAADAYNGQKRSDLADAEMQQASVIETYLPAQLSEEEVAKIVDDIITQTGASSMKDMGKVMGMTAQKLAGKADNKLVSNLVKAKLG
ncbi:MAG: GatB/YqeY domain-containing protein [Salibacteraceae bacterium]|nr:GatB/YqeY domain-containing protein [Salibacteraceae bacterium]